MIPTFWGRVQTRLFLFFLVGVPITILVSLWVVLFFEDSISAFLTPYLILWTSLVVGIVLDVFYILIQKLRWDRDWPFAFQFLAGILEGWILFGLLRLGLIFVAPSDLPWGIFWTHYSLVFWGSFLIVYGPIKTFSPILRYHGGKFFGN